ncbi:MAG: hypothetical protein A2X23_13030 [Chloroflexi bacterium GWC2_73_18]|nr:MAG: hypothetical protein A2X23_13030 [Chloroflexi bacterium GWC2_73_18]
MSNRPRGRLGAVLLAALLVSGILPVSALAAAPTDAPNLLSPDPGATVSANPVLSWDAVTGATKYRVQVSAVSNFSTFSYNVDTYDRRATPPTDLPLGTLYWRVAGMDVSGNLGPWGSSSFDKDWNASPAPVSPADGATLVYPNDPLLFSWQPLPGANSYVLQIDDAADFIGASSYATANTSYTLTEPQTIGQTFYWRVQGISPAAINSEWSATRSYSIGWPVVPTLLGPPNTTLSSIEEVVLSWSPVVGAATYEIQVSPNGDWANNVKVDAFVKGTRYSPPSGLNNGSFFWRVRARDAKSTPNNGGWSAEWQFTRGWPDRPTLLTPTDGNYLVSTPTFSWTPVDHAAYYELSVGTDSNFSPATYQVCYTNHTEFTPYAPIQTGGEPGTCGVAPQIGSVYYWRVRGIDAPNKVDTGTPALGLWSNVSSSDVFSFLYRPDIPTLTAPSEGAPVATPVLKWNFVPGQGKYRVTIKKSGGATAVTADTYATSYTPTGTLNPADSPFSWYVQTIDANNRLGLIPAMSDWWTFNLIAPGTTYAAPDPLTPADGATSQRMPAMTWRPVTGASYYRVKYGVDGTGVENYLSGTTQLRFAGFTYQALTLSPATYFWYVEAYDASNAVIGLGAQQTFTILDLNEASYDSPVKCTPLQVCAKLPDTPTLSWDSVSRAGGYIVYVSLDADFTNIYRRYWTIHTTLTPRESYLDNQAGQAYYWFVRPCTQGQTSPCGAYDSSVFPRAYAFQKRSAAVELTAPADDASVADQVVFRWRDYLDTNGDLANPVTQEARSYHIQVSTVADFASTLDNQTVDQTTYTPFGLTYPEGPLYWRVQAVDGTGNTLTYSAIRSLTKASPEVILVAPADGATVTGLPAFRWTPQAYAARYEIEAYKNGDLLFSSSNRVLLAQTKTAAWAPTNALPADTYAWRLRRLDADGRAGPWSDGRTFILQPKAPALLSPSDGWNFANDNLLFQWSAVSGVPQYRFESSASSSFSTIFESQTTVMTSWAPTRQYTAETTWYWRAKALNAAGIVVSTSETRSFGTYRDRPWVKTMSPKSAAPVNGGFKVTFSEKVEFVSTTTFKMRIAGTATAIAGTVTPSSSTATTSATFKPSSALVPGQWYTLSLTSGIQDLTGNPLVPASWTVRTGLVVENTSVALVELWDRDTNAAANGGAYGASRTTDARTTFTFTGTNVTLLGHRAPDGGYAEVWLDGALSTGSVSFYNAANQWKVAVWSRSGLANAKHTVEVRVKGTRPAASSDRWAYVDAFKVGAVSYEEDNAAVRDRFARVSAAQASGGSYDVTTHLKAGDTSSKPAYRITFRGTGIDWYATKTPTSGKAQVILDGASRGIVDLYSASNAYKTKIFSSATLNDGVHTLRIEILGDRQAASGGTDVSLDRFLVR